MLDLIRLFCSYLGSVGSVSNLRVVFTLFFFLGSFSSTLHAKSRSSHSGISSVSRYSSAYVLSLFWSPTVCSHPDNISPGDIKSIRNNCNAAKANRDYTASLHGLWTQYSDHSVGHPFFCSSIPYSEQGLPSSLVNRIHNAYRFTSKLYLHEWAKHGTCYDQGSSIQDYFTKTLDLYDKYNHWPSFVVNNVGKSVSLNGILNSFGSMSSSVVLYCSNIGGKQVLFSVFIFLDLSFKLGKPSTIGQKACSYDREVFIPDFTLCTGE